MTEFLAFLTLTVTILGASCGNKAVGKFTSAINNSTAVALYWDKGKVPFEISQQFVSNESSVIKEALIEIMNTTCIKFVPRSSESDYLVFMEYTHPDQKTGTCWSGKWNNGSGSIENQRGRHIVSLWPSDLECFSKFSIIRELLNILGFQTKPSNIKTSGKTIIKIHDKFEENLGFIGKNNFFRTSCEKDLTLFLRNPFALDNKEWILATTRASCTLVRSVIQLNLSYNCSARDMSSTSANFVSKLDSVSPNCKAEAEAGTCKSDPVYMSAVCEKHFCYADTYKSLQECDFVDYDISVQPISMDNPCAELCLANPNCTHFAWGYLSNCYLKSATKGIQISYSPGSSCGYIPNRVPISFDWQDGGDGLISWANDCDFWGNDIRQLREVKREGCGMFCTVLPACTHFTWFEDLFCNLKSWSVNGSDPSAAVPFNSTGSCGWIKSRVNGRESRPVFQG